MVKNPLGHQIRDNVDDRGGGGLRHNESQQNQRCRIEQCADVSAAVRQDVGVQEPAQVDQRKGRQCCPGGDLNRDGGGGLQQTDNGPGQKRQPYSRDEHNGSTFLPGGGRFRQVACFPDVGEFPDETHVD